MMKVEVGCCMCSEKFTAEIAAPGGWLHRYDEINDDQGFCAKHAPIAAFAESQCPGCVYGWGDCPLWEAFAYSYRRTINSDDYRKLEAGICPKRVNGTMTLNVGAKNARLEEMDISERATRESGSALAQAIKDYCAKYPVAA